MVYPPLSTNPLRTRADVQQSVRDLWAPLQPILAKDGAAAQLGECHANYGRTAGALETIARPLWGMVPLSAGGGDFPDWALYHRIIEEGTNPAHRHFWGEPRNNDQRAVEMGAIALAILLVPHSFWSPLSKDTQGRLVSWLSSINRLSLYTSNWLYFRVMVNAALKAVGGDADEERVLQDRRQLDSFYLGEGWYTDGKTRQRDYYVPMAFHFYALILAKADSGLDESLRELSRKRARDFAPGFSSWFASDGSAVPFGRSLSYRFAQGAFWGALAFADVPALSWGQLKGLYLRHLRYWFGQPIFHSNGILSVGYGYPNQIIAEGYNAPASPYWAFKAFLPLALPETHPFWTATEEAHPENREVDVQTTGGFVLCRDIKRDHVFALANQEVPVSMPRHSAQKYSKFAYSAVFTFNTPVGGTGPEAGAGDSTLLVSRDRRQWQSRETIQADRIKGSTLYTHWTPLEGVEIDTWLAPALPGYLRVHRIRSSATLHTFEGGFPIQRDASLKENRDGDFSILLSQTAATSLIRDLTGSREVKQVNVEPSTNLQFPLSSVPGLSGTLPAGETWLFSAVVGLPGPKAEGDAMLWSRSFTVELGASPPCIKQEQTVLLRCELPDETPSGQGRTLTPKPRPSKIKRVLRSLLSRLDTILAK